MDATSRGLRIRAGCLEFPFHGGEKCVTKFDFAARNMWVQLLAVPPIISPRSNWIAELASHDELFFKLYNRLPREFPSIRALLLASLWRTPAKK